MKKAKLIPVIIIALVLALITGVLLVCVFGGDTEHNIVVDGKLAEGDTIEYTGGKIQFPVGHIADQYGNVISYNVLYKVINLADQSELTDEYAAFDLKPGSYQIIYTYGEDDSVSKTVSFKVVDTTAPAVAFMEIPNGLFLQDITADTVNKLPLYSLEDASAGAGIDLKQTLKFKGEGDADFKEYPFRKINNSYEIHSFGTFVYELTATDCYGNTTTVACQWNVKDRTWKPEQALPEGVLADYAEEGYCNLVEGGNVNQYYKIDNDYSDSYLAEFEGAQGVLKITMGFNNAAGYGNNTIRLRVPKTFTKEDLEGKYLAIRIYVEGEHLKNTFLFGGNNVEFRAEDSTTRAFTAGMTGLETGKWMTFYLEAAAVENIGMYPNATYNPDTTFYEGGDPAEAIQLCFHREAGYFNDMTLYIDSISIAERLPDTTLTISGDHASWTAVEGATGYRVILSGEEMIITETSIALSGEKGYIRVTPLGNGVTTLDAKTVTGVYGLDAGDSVAKFDDPLSAELFNDRLNFSDENEHNGYRPVYMNSSITSEGLKMEIGTGAWGVVTGVRLQFPEAQGKGNNTTLVLNMQVSNSKYGQIRVYDYTGKQLGVIKLDESNTGKFCEFEIDISSYDSSLEGIQLIFGPNETFTSVSEGVTITFKEINLTNSYYTITVDGHKLQCAGTRKPNAGYTADTLVQLVNFFNFGVPADDTPLGFSGTVLINGREVTDVTVVGYPGTETICFKGIPHKGKVLTIMKDSVIYYDGIAVIVEETINAMWDGSAWTYVDEIPEPEEPQKGTLSFEYRYGTNSLIQVNTNLPVSTPIANFLVTDNGCSIDQSGNPYQQVGWIQMANADGTIVLTFHFNSAFAAGQYYVLPAGAVFGFTDGSTYTLEDTYVFTWNGENWTVSDTVPAPEGTEPETTEPEGTEPEITELNLQYYAGTNSLIGVATNLPASTPLKNFLANDNGCIIDQSGNPYQQVGYIEMVNQGGTIGLIFHFNKAFEVGQYYILPAGSVFGFTDGKTYTLNDTYVFIWDGSSWTVSDTVPAPDVTEPEETEPEVTEPVATEPEATEPEATEPEITELNLQYYAGTNNMIGVATNLPASTPLKNFLAGDNGCNIDQSANPYQQVGYIEMVNQGGTIGLIFHFNEEFEVGQYYVLPAGAVFGFTNGKTYPMDATYVFIWDGTGWTVSDTVPAPEVTEPVATEPEVTEPEITELNMQYYAGTNNMIGVATNLPASTPLKNFLAGDNGCSIDQSGNPYQQVGYIEMVNQGGTIGLIFHFNEEFEVGQYYVLPAGAVFGFTNGKTYPLDANYVFTWDGTNWSVSDTVPAPEGTEPEGTEPEVTEPEITELNMQYYAGTNNMIGVATNLPASTPLKNFLAGDNGCSIDQSGNPYQQVGYIEMVNQGGTIGLIFHFNEEFEVGQYYVLPAGAVFGFTNGKTYPLDANYVFTWDGTKWTVSDAVPTPEPGEPEEPEKTDLNLQYQQGSGTMIAVSTDLPATTPIANFLATDNGCNIDQTVNPYQQVGWFGMMNVEGTIVLTFNFGNAFEAGQYYILPTGSVFGFTDGKTYTLNDTYVFIWDGSSWTVSDTVPVPEKTDLNLQYQQGTSTMIAVSTDLPATTPIANFLATDNGCVINQSANPYQQVGWFGMMNVEGTIVLTFNFGNAFEAGQYYILPAGSVFGFTDGKTYTLNDTYVFIWDGSSWTVSDTVPVPEKTDLNLQYQQGTSTMIAVSTDLPATTPIANFLATDNGCVINQSANPYQQVGWIQMANVEGIIGLVFHFNSGFEAGQYYILPAGSVFGFTDGSSYTLDATYTFTCDGSNWTMTKS